VGRSKHLIFPQIRNSLFLIRNSQLWAWGQKSVELFLRFFQAKTPERNRDALD
jgi:hypothetical protein